jgi:hypothetical protein
MIPTQNAPAQPALEIEDNEENYRSFLAYLLSQTKSRGNTRYYNKFAGKCRDRAALMFPRGSKMAAKNNMQTGGVLAGLFTLFGFL